MGSYEFDEVVDEIIIHGLYREGVRLVRQGKGPSYVLAVRRDVRPGWTINRVSRWAILQNEKPIAYRLDGMQVWPSDMLHKPFFVAQGPSGTEWRDADDRYIRFIALEDAMKAVDECFPVGRVRRYPESIVPIQRPRDVFSAA